MKINEIINEASEFPSSQVAAAPGMKKHTELDNSSPYHAYQFAAKFLPGSPHFEHKPSKEGPIGQSLVTVAYSQGDADIIDAAEAAFGIKSQRVSPNGSNEDTTIHRVSPHRQVGAITLIQKKK
jgi:hypothetical protein